MAGKKLNPKYQVEGDEILSKGYLRNFLKWYPSITSKKAFHFDSLREDWCSEKSLIMYIEVFKAMVDCKAAIKLDKEMVLDKRLSTW
jgi:hypothetical protein